jgi:hypothetical protein
MAWRAAAVSTVNVTDDGGPAAGEVLAEGAAGLPSPPQPERATRIETRSQSFEDVCRTMARGPYHVRRRRLALDAAAPPLRGCRRELKMASTASISRAVSTPAGSEVSVLRLHILRATYLLLIVGVGAMVLPPILSHAPTARGVIPSLLAGVWVLSFLGLRYPLQMLPVLMFEFAWKAIWLLAFGLSQWWSGQAPPTFAEDFFAITVGVILMPAVIPWGYVWRHYVRKPGDRWR